MSVLRRLSLAFFAASLLPGLVPGASRADEALDTIRAEDIGRHARVLASDAYEGRGTASPGARKAARYLAAELQRLGLEPGAPGGSFFQRFEVAGPARVGPDARLEIEVGPWRRALTLGRDYNPLDLSDGLEGAELPLVFCGYGIHDPENGYDDYAGLDVTGKAVLVLRHQPREKDGLTRLAWFRTKVETARVQGARALFVVTDPLHHPQDDSVLPFRGGQPGGIFAAHVRRTVVESLFRLAGKDLRAEQVAIDETRAPRSFALEARVRVGIEISRGTETAQNVVARIPGRDPALAGEAVVIGAHYDHLGRGEAGGSLAPGSRGQIHNGADDNASGTAGLLELAEAFAKVRPRRTIYIVHFSGEERGLLGSAHFVQNPPVPAPSIVAMVNLDMIGRLKDGKLSIGGVDTDAGFRGIAEAAARAEGLTAALDGGGFGPSDHASFYRARVPVLFFFTGLHDDYHRPSDDVERLELEGAARVTRAAYRSVRAIADGDARPAYVRVGRPRRPRLGIRPSRQSRGGGVEVATVLPGGPAAKAGFHAADRLVQLGEREISSLRDLLRALSAHKPGDEVRAVLMRGEARVEVTIKLGS